MDSKGFLWKAGSLRPLLFLFTLLLCKNGTSESICADQDPRCQKNIRLTFYLAMELSNYILKNSVEMYSEFNRNYFHSPSLCTVCHTESIFFPQSYEEARQIQPILLINMMLRILHAWDKPLSHLINEAKNLPQALNAVLSKAATEIRKENKNLIEGLQAIALEVDSAIKEDTNHADWLGLPSLQSVQEQTRFSAFHNLLYCLRKDCHKIDAYIRVLRCRLAYDGMCKANHFSLK